MTRTLKVVSSRVWHSGSSKSSGTQAHSISLLFIPTFFCRILPHGCKIPAPTPNIKSSCNHSNSRIEVAGKIEPSLLEPLFFDWVKMSLSEATKKASHYVSLTRTGSHVHSQIYH